MLPSGQDEDASPFSAAPRRSQRWCSVCARLRIQVAWATSPFLHHSLGVSARPTHLFPDLHRTFGPTPRPQFPHGRFHRLSQAGLCLLRQPPPCRTSSASGSSDIKDAIAALAEPSPTPDFTHVLSVVSSASISFITDCCLDLAIPAEEVRRVVAGENSAPPAAAAVRLGTLMRVVERAGHGLRVTRMAVPLRDTEEEDLLDRLEPRLEFIDEGRKVGNVLVHCFAGVSRSASIIVAYLMRSEQKSLEDALEAVKEISESACPNDGFLDQLKLFEEMGFKVDTSSPLYKKFRLKLLGDSSKTKDEMAPGINHGIQNQLHPTFYKQLLQINSYLPFI